MPKARALLVLPYVLVQEALTRSHRGRIPEPMVMDDPASVAAFHDAGTVDGTNMPMYEVCARALSRLLPADASLLDLGSGSGRFLTHLAHHRPDVRIVGLDLSEGMIATGRRLIEAEGLSHRVRLVKADITSFADDIAEQVAVVSAIWALHQLPTAEHLDACLRRIADIRRKTGCGVFLADFARLRNARSFPLMVPALADPSPTLRQDGLASECAGWSFDELTGALERAGLADLQHSIARPLRILQLHWAQPTIDGSLDGTDDLWRELPLPRRARIDAAFWWRAFRPRPGDAAPRRRGQQRRYRPLPIAR